jgi:hypothetical protein
LNLLRCPTTSYVEFWHILKIHLEYHILQNVPQCKVTSRKYALKQGNRIGVHFIKIDIQGVFLKCVEILPTRLWDKVED